MEAIIWTIPSQTIAQDIVPEEQHEVLVKSDSGKGDRRIHIHLKACTPNRTELIAIKFKVQDELQA